MISATNDPYNKKGKTFELKPLDRRTAGSLYRVGESIGSTQALQTGIRPRGKSALGFLEKINYINSSSNPVFNSIAFDTEFLEFSGKKKPLQIGIASATINYVKDTTASTQVVRDNINIGNVAKSRIKNAANALVITGIDDETAKYLQDISKKISSGGVPTSEELRNFRYILTYKDMKMASQPLTKGGYSNYAGVLPLNYFQSKVNVINAKDYLTDYQKAISNLRNAYLQQNASNNKRNVIEQVMETVGGSLEMKNNPTEFIFHTGSAGDIEILGDFLEIKKTKGKYNKETIARAFGLNPNRSFFIDTEAAARVVDRKAIGFKAEEVAKRFGFEDEYLHLANSDAMTALMNSIALTEKAFDLKTISSSLNIKRGESYLARSSFDTRSLGKDIIFQQIFSEEGYNAYKEGRVGEITKQQISRSTWAVGRGDIITVEDIKESITSSGRETASKWHKQLILKNNVTNEYSVIAFANEEAIQQFAEAISIAPKTDSGQIGGGYLERRFQSKLADARSEYSHFFQGGYEGWKMFDNYFEAFEDVMSGFGDDLSEEARGIIASPTKLAGVLRSFQQRTSSLSGAELEVKEAFFRKAKDTSKLSTSKKIEHFIKMSPELAIKQEGFRSFRKNVYESITGVGKKESYIRRKLAGDALSFGATEIDKTAKIFGGRVLDTTDVVIDMSKMGAAGRFNLSSVPDLATSIRSYVNSLSKASNISGPNVSAAANYERFITAISGRDKFFTYSEGQDLLKSLREELAGQARPLYISTTIADKMYDKFSDESFTKKILGRLRTPAATDVAYSMSGRNTTEGLGKTLTDMYRGVLNEYALTGISKNPAASTITSKQLGASDIYTRQILEKIGSKGLNLSKFGSGEKGAETVVDSIISSYQKRGILAKLEIDDAGKMAINLAYSGGTGMSGVSASAMRNVATMNIPVLNPYNGTIMHNGTALANKAQFGYSDGKLTFGTAFENYLSEMANPRTQARIASYLEQGEVSTAQAIIKQIENQNILDLQRYGGDISEAYRAGAADNPIQIHMKRHRLSYEKFVEDYLKDLNFRDPSTKSLTSLDRDKLAAYMLKDPSLLDEMIKNGPSSQYKQLASIAKDMRQVFTDTLGEEDAKRLLRFGFTRADQIGENYLPGFGPQAYSVFGKAGISSRSAMVQSLNAVGLSEEDYIYVGNKRIRRSTAAKGLAGTGDGKARNYAFRFGVGTEQAYAAFGEDRALMQAAGKKAGRVRGLNIHTAYLDDEMMQKIIAANIAKGNFAQAGALAPTIRDSAAIMMSEAYDAFQTANTRKLVGSAKDALSLTNLMDAKNIEELQEIIKSGDASKLTINSDNYLMNKGSKMNVLRGMGYKGSHTSVLTDIKSLATGGFEATWAEFTPLLKISDLAGTKGTINLLSKKSWNDMIQNALDYGVLSADQATLLHNANLLMPLEKKTAAAANEAILNKFVFDLNQAKVSSVEKKQAVIDLLGPEVSPFVRTARGSHDIIIDNINANIKFTSSAFMAQKAQEIMANNFKLNIKYGLGGIVSGIANIGVARIYDYAGITPMKMNKQMQEQLSRNVFRIFGNNKELLTEAQEAILNPIEAQIKQAAIKKSPLYQAVLGDIDLLLSGAVPDASKDSVIWTRTGANLDNVRKGFKEQGYDLKELITKEIPRGSREAWSSASSDLLKGTYYDLGMDLDKNTGLSKRFFFELPEEITIGEGADARRIKYVPMTFRELPRDEAGIFTPDSIQEKQARLIQMTDEYLYPKGDESLDAITRKSRYSASAKGIIGELLKEEHNAIKYNKGFIREQILSYRESFSSSFWAAPQNILSSDLLTEKSLDRFLGSADNATKETYAQFIEASKAIRAASGAQADAYFTSSSIKSLIETEGRRTGKTFSDESIENIIKRFRAGTVIEMGRSPMKDPGTVGLFRARVLTAEEEKKAIDLMRIEGETEKAAAERFQDLTKNRIVLDPSAAKVLLADFDGDAIVAKFLGLKTSGKDVVVDEAAMQKFERLEPYFRKFYEGASEVFVDRKGVVGDIASDVMEEVLIDRSNNAIEEIGRSIAATSKTYTGSMFSVTQDLLERSQLMARGAGELKDITAFSKVNKIISGLEVWSSVLQQIGIGGKKVQERITAQKLSKEQASMIMETTSSIASDFSKGIFTREKELLGSLESLGFIDESGKFLGRSGALASQDIAEEINITDIKEAIQDVRVFNQGSYYKTGRIYGENADTIFSEAIRAHGNRPLNQTLQGEVESLLRGENISDTTESLGEKLNSFLSSKRVIDSTTEAGEKARAKFTGEALHGFNNFLKSPNLKRAGVGALGGLAALMVVGKLTAPDISQTGDRSAVDRSVTTEGTYLNPDVFQGAPQGAGPTMGLPPAYLSPSDSGYNKVMINIRGRNGSGLGDNNMIQYIQSEINSQIPLDFKFNYQASDTRDHLDKNWLDQQISNVFNYGYTKG